MKLEEMKSRWQQDALLIEVREVCLTKVPPRQISRRDWYEQYFPKEVHPYTNEYCKDLRGIDLSGGVFDSDHWFSDARLENSSFRKVRITGANFQNAVLAYADFSGSEITEGHFLVICAHQANFSHCTISDSSFGGFNPMRNGPGPFGFSDLTSSSFAESTVSKTSLNNADFRGADFQGAVFSDCDFTGSDLRGIQLDEHTRFIRCDFRCVLLDNRRPFRAIFRHGLTPVLKDCLNLDAVNWVRDASFPDDPEWLLDAGFVLPQRPK